MTTNKLKQVKSRSGFSINITTLVILLAVYYTVVFNFPILEKFYQLSDSDLPLYLVSYILLISAFVIIFTLLAWPYLFKVVLIPLTLTSALSFYASLKYSVMFDYTMIENIFETHSGEAVSYINTTAILYFVGFGLLPTLLLFKVKITYSNTLLKTLFLKGVSLCGAIAVILLIAVFYYKDYASIGRNNAYLNKMINPAHAYNTYKYIKRHYLTKPMQYLPLGEDARMIGAMNNKPTLMIFIVGETARSQNIAYNGYQRNTNPYTQGLGLISFQNVATCGTATAVSLPCMFSNMSRSEYNKNRAINQDNVLDVLTHAGVKVDWVENDGGDKGVAQNIHKITINKDQNKDLCNKSSCFDEVMLRQLPELIEQAPKTDKLIALHLIGSHGPTYYQRYPKDKARFTPACEQSDIENCSDQEIVNVYDNTIAYTDYVIAQTIEQLKRYQAQYNVALFYISDHGESLGENGFYLHGTPYVVAPNQQTQVPWFIWASNDYYNGKGINKSCLQEVARTNKLSHDNLFHTLLGFYGVDTQSKIENLDIISGCKLQS
jgi:lipid A ethanolaminephosphotransferase